jgi:hypothetical protein
MQVILYRGNWKMSGRKCLENTVLRSFRLSDLDRLQDIIMLIDICDRNVHRIHTVVPAFDKRDCTNIHSFRHNFQPSKWLQNPNFIISMWHRFLWITWLPSKFLNSTEQNIPFKPWSYINKWFTSTSSDERVPHLHPNIMSSFRNVKIRPCS